MCLDGTKTSCDAMLGRKGSDCLTIFLYIAFSASKR
ncbi:hypothetical protein CBM2586_B130592 [Cupriavidus phytorum]|uniref:Uncharacterized protein n=1 Tax=Cupriavidus taiwanensis TaxID=164546 RepID=A0A975XLG7_9BURK|nr:hypothetical protein CBM2586_B130592 [Cupriavidus taiwanensis]